MVRSGLYVMQKCGFSRVQKSEKYFEKIELPAPTGAPGWIFLSFQRRHQINAGSVFKLRTAIVKERSSRDPVGVQAGSSRGPAGIQQRPLRASGGFN